jgi:transposase
LNRNRRLSKDYERKIESAEAWLYLSMSILMLKRFKN